MKTMYQIDQIAAEIWGINPVMLPTKTRKREVVEARQVLMVYRHVQRSLSQKIAARRYNRDHATTVHAMKKVDELKHSNKKFAEKLKLFNEKVSCQTNNN